MMEEKTGIPFLKMLLNIGKTFTVLNRIRLNK